MFFVSPEGDRYYLGHAFTYKGVQYSADGATKEKFTELGFKQVIPDQMPSTTFWIYSDCDNDGHWNETPRDLDELKAAFVQQELEIAQEQLKETDYMFARAAEKTLKFNAAGLDVESTDVPAEVSTNRDAIRAKCKSNIELIEATTTVDELEALMPLDHEASLAVKLTVEML